MGNPYSFTEAQRRQYITEEKKFARGVMADTCVTATISKRTATYFAFSMMKQDPLLFGSVFDLQADLRTRSDILDQSADKAGTKFRIRELIMSQNGK